MQKRFTLLMLCSLFSMPVMAQEGVHFGIQAGENITSLIDDVRYGDVDYMYRPTFGFSYGITAGWNFSDYLGIQAEVNRSEMGEKIFMRTNPDFQEHIYLNYTQIPVMFKFSGGDYKSRFAAMVGPQWSFLNSATLSRNGSENYPDEHHQNVENSFAKSNFGMIVTAGGDVSIVPSLYVNLQLRFMYGFHQANTSPNVLFNELAEDDHLHTISGGIYAGLHYLIRPQDK